LDSKKFICFIGLDGSGKSTHAKFLYDQIKLKNNKTKFVYGRFVPYISKFTMKLGKKIFLKNEKSNDYNIYLDNKRKVIKNRSLLSKFYFDIIFLETFFQIMIKIKLPLVFGYSIIADRYIQDTIINEFSVDLDLSVKESNNLLNKFLKFLPKPNVTFFIDISEEIAFQRKQDIPSLEYLKIRSKYYRSLELDKITIINGEKSVKQIQKLILNKVCC